MNQIELGKTVVRIARDYTNGRKGRVIELDPQNSRARVAWQGLVNGWGKPVNLRTWVRIADLTVQA